MQFGLRVTARALLVIALGASSRSQTPLQCVEGPVTRVYVVSASSGTPIPQTHLSSYVFKNDLDFVVRLKDINPFAFKCSVTANSQSYQESAIGSFLGIIGGVANVGATTPEPSGKAPPAPAGATRSFIARGVTHDVPKNDCVNRYLDDVHNGEVKQLQDQRDAINGALQNAAAAAGNAIVQFGSDVADLRNQRSCRDTVRSATTLVGRPAFTISAVNGLPLGQAIDQLSNQAQNLLTHLTDNTDACKDSLRALIDDDSAFLSALVHGTTAVPAAVDQWRTQLTQLNGVRSQLDAARANVQTVLQNPQNFTIDTPVSGNQTKVTVTISCSPVAVLQVSSAPSPPSATATANPASPAPAGNPGAQTANTWSHDFSFGVGPRFVLSGGLVVSPLPQVTYSTTTNPNGGNGQPTNIIISQQGSSTRILPIVMLHARFWDQLSKSEWVKLLPNYLSVGVTAKSSDNKGTNIEYLFGPSWTFAGRQIFISAGAYAGQQQRLEGGLMLGQATNLGSANLPISLRTIWKPGFAITWAPAGK